MSAVLGSSALAHRYFVSSKSAKSMRDNTGEVIKETIEQKKFGSK